MQCPQLKLSDSSNFPDTEEKRRRLTVQVARDLRCLIVCKGYHDFITDGVHCMCAYVELPLTALELCLSSSLNLVVNLNWMLCEQWSSVLRRTACAGAADRATS